MSYQYDYSGKYINYTRIEELYPNKFNLAPRYHTYYPGDTDSMEKCNYPTETPLITGGIYFINMEREEEISAGTSSWPFPDLKEGECVLTRDFIENVYPEYNLVEG